MHPKESTITEMAWTWLGGSATTRFRRPSESNYEPYSLHASAQGKVTSGRASTFKLPRCHHIMLIPVDPESPDRADRGGWTRRRQPPRAQRRFQHGRQCRWRAGQYHHY